MPKTLRKKFGWLNIMKSVLSLDAAPSALERSLGLQLNLKVSSRQACRWRGLDMQEILVIEKALRGIQGEFLNNTSKLTEIDKRIERDTKELEEVKNDSSYTDEQR